MPRMRLDYRYRVAVKSTGRPMRNNNLNNGSTSGGGHVLVPSCRKAVSSRNSFASVNNRDPRNNEAESDNESSSEEVTDSEEDSDGSAATVEIERPKRPIPKPEQSEVEILRDRVKYLEKSRSSMKRKYEQKIRTLNNRINDARRLEYGRELILHELETTSTRVFAQLRQNASNNITPTL